MTDACHERQLLAPHLPAPSSSHAPVPLLIPSLALLCPPRRLSTRLQEYGLDYAKLEDALPHRSHDQLRAFYTSHRRSLELDALLVKQGHVAPGSRAGRPSKRSLAAAGLAEQEGTAGDDAEDFLE